MNRGLYLHIPFCVRKCGYCAFYSETGSLSLRKAYADALIRSVCDFMPGRRFSIDTVYFGGGTPTLLGPDLLAGILDAVRSRFDLTDDAEITLEANPGTVDPGALSALRQAGFTRLSFGVQSLYDEELRMLGRIHTADEARQALLAAHRAGFDHLSADLMAGIPRQTPVTLKDSLHQMAALPIDHVSVYLLSIEPGTPFAAKKEALNLPDDDAMADDYLLLCEETQKLGFAQYEVSNFARPGGACRHNIHYWRCEEYLAFGPAANGYLDGRRYAFAPDLHAFIQSAGNGIFQTEDLGAGGDFDEVFFLGMRLKEGVSLRALERRFGRILSRLRLRAAPLVRAGFLLLENGDRLSFTPKGYAVSNQILAELLF